MKKTACLILAFVLTLTTAVSAYAVPDSVSYLTTKWFLQLLDEKDIHYTLHGIDQDNDEVVIIQFGEMTAGKDINVLCFFSKNLETCSMRIWNLIDFAPSKINTMYRVVNDLNDTYRFAVFVVDKKDNSVTLRMDCCFEAYTADNVCFDMLVRMLAICKSAMDTLSPYQK